MLDRGLSMEIRPLFRWFGLAILVLGGADARAGRWDWPLEFTAESGRTAKAAYLALAGATCSGAVEVPVVDVFWRDDAFELHLVGGMLYLCPAVDLSLIHI